MTSDSGLDFLVVVEEQCDLVTSRPRPLSDLGVLAVSLFSLSYVLLLLFSFSRLSGFSDLTRLLDGVPASTLRRRLEFSVADGVVGTCSPDSRDLRRASAGSTGSVLISCALLVLVVGTAATGTGASFDEVDEEDEDEDDELDLSLRWDELEECRDLSPDLTSLDDDLDNSGCLLLLLLREGFAGGSTTAAGVSTGDGSAGGGGGSSFASIGGSLAGGGGGGGKGGGGGGGGRSTGSLVVSSLSCCTSSSVAITKLPSVSSKRSSSIGSAG